MVDLRKFAAENEIIIGACPPEPICANRLRASPFVPFVVKNLEKRRDPTKVFPDAKSIIVVGVKNLSPNIWAKPAMPDLPTVSSSLIGYPASSPPNFVALSSLGTDFDYHKRVKKVLSILANTLEKSLGSRGGAGFMSKVLVDSPTLDEREFAHKAGLGFFGRNGLIISPVFGSRFNIGLLLTNIAFGDLSQQADTHTACPDDCSACISACPTGALREGEPLDIARCVSYLTQKKELSHKEEPLIGNQLYGCDICQDVCPFNSPREKMLVDPRELIESTDEEIIGLFAHTAMLWQGTGILRRNARVLVSRYQ